MGLFLEICDLEGFSRPGQICCERISSFCSCVCLGTVVVKCLKILQHGTVLQITHIPYVYC